MPDHTPTRTATDGGGGESTSNENVLARLTRWFRQRPNSIEFWELVLTDDRLLWCFVGESFRSLLLRADVGERDRAAVAERPPAAIASSDERNFAVPLEDLAELRLVTGTLLRRARLVVRWRTGDDGTGTDERTLYQSRTADSQPELVAELASDHRLEHVDVTVDAPRFPSL